MRRSCLYLLLCICSIIVGVFVTHTLWVLSHTFTPDFGVYYQAGENMFTGSSLYLGKPSFTLFAYPPVSAVLFVPFVLLPYSMSQIVFLFISFGALLGISIIVPFLINHRFSFFFSMVVFSLSYFSFPTKFTFGMGQINLIAYFFLLLGLFFYLSRSDLDKKAATKGLLIAFCLAIAYIAKPILGFTVLFFIFQKQWKILAYVGILFAMFFVICCVVDLRAIPDWLYYVQHVIPEIGKPVGKEIYYNQGWIGFVFRETKNTFMRLWLGYLGLLGILGLLIGVLVKQKNPLYQFCIILTALPLLDTMSWQHHFVFLILPFASMFWLSITQKRWKLFGVICLAYLLVSSNIAQPNMFLHTPWNIVLSNTFYGAFVLFILFLTVPLVVKRAA